MTTPAQTLKEKLAAEASLRPTLEKFHDDVARSMGALYAKSGDLLNMQQFNDPLGEILVKHYTIVTEEFSDRLRHELPADVEITDAESDLIGEALAIWVLSRVPLAVNRINGTTQDQINDAVEFGLQDPASRELVGLEAQRTVAAIAARKLRRDLAARESGILMTETQIPAEAAKATEAEVLSGLEPSVIGGSARISELNKEWISVGDHRVRPTHLEADGQVVPMSEPFNVGGELLRWPGDDELGASLSNIINCRCDSSVDVAKIIDRRRYR